MKSRSMIFTLYGDYIQYYGGEIWIGSLIRLMEQFGFNAQAVRAAVSRMSRQGWLQVRKEGNKSYYKMTKRGVKRLEEAAQRIYKLKQEPWDGKWRMLIYTIPEEKRSIRDELRKELIWSGFGQISTSCWVTPVDLHERVVEMFDRYEINLYVDYFICHYQGPGTSKSMIEKCWNIEDIRLRYTEFMDTYKKKFGETLRNKDDRMFDNALCFVERTKLVHEYRKFLFYDPGLPEELLPQGWIGTEAAQLFREYYQQLAVTASHFFEIVFYEGYEHKRREDDVTPHPFS